MMASLKMGETVGDRFVQGFLFYGVLVGKYEYVALKLGEKVEYIIADTRKAVEVLRGERQALWATL